MDETNYCNLLFSFFSIYLKYDEVFYSALQKAEIDSPFLTSLKDNLLQEKNLSKNGSNFFKLDNFLSLKKQFKKEFFSKEKSPKKTIPMILEEVFLKMKCGNCSKCRPDPKNNKLCLFHALFHLKYVENLICQTKKCENASFIDIKKYAVPSFITLLFEEMINLNIRKQFFRQKSHDLAFCEICKNVLDEKSDLRFNFAKHSTSFLMFFLEYRENPMTKKDINLVYDGIFLTFPANINKNNININNKNVSYFLMGISCEKELGLMNFFRNDENLWILCDEKLRVEYSWEELIKSKTIDEIFHNQHQDMERKVMKTIGNEEFKSKIKKNEEYPNNDQDQDMKKKLMKAIGNEEFKSKIKKNEESPILKKVNKLKSEEDSPKDFSKKSLKNQNVAQNNNEIGDYLKKINTKNIKESLRGTLSKASSNPFKDYSKENMKNVIPDKDAREKDKDDEKLEKKKKKEKTEIEEKNDEKLEKKKKEKTEIEEKDDKKLIEKKKKDDKKLIEKKEKKDDDDKKMVEKKKKEKDDDEKIVEKKKKKDDDDEKIVEKKKKDDKKLVEKKKEKKDDDDEKIVEKKKKEKDDKKLVEKKEKKDDDDEKIVEKKKKEKDEEKLEIKKKKKKDEKEPEISLKPKEKEQKPKEKLIEEFSQSKKKKEKDSEEIKENIQKKEKKKYKSKEKTNEKMIDEEEIPSEINGKKVIVSSRISKKESKILLKQLAKNSFIDEYNIFKEFTKEEQQESIITAIKKKETTEKKKLNKISSSTEEEQNISNKKTKKVPLFFIANSDEEEENKDFEDKNSEKKNQIIMKTPKKTISESENEENFNPKKKKSTNKNKRDLKSTNENKVNIKNKNNHSNQNSSHSKDRSDKNVPIIKKMSSNSSIHSQKVLSKYSNQKKISSDEKVSNLSGKSQNEKKQKSSNFSNEKPFEKSSNDEKKPENVKNKDIFSKDPNLSSHETCPSKILPFLNNRNKKIKTPSNQSSEESEEETKRSQIDKKDKKIRSTIDESSIFPVYNSNLSSKNSQNVKENLLKKFDMMEKN